MSMLRLTSGETRNEMNCIHRNLGVTSIGDKMKEGQLIGFGHVY